MLLFAAVRPMGPTESIDCIRVHLYVWGTPPVSGLADVTAKRWAAASRAIPSCRRGELPPVWPRFHIKCKANVHILPIFVSTLKDFGPDTNQSFLPPKDMRTRAQLQCGTTTAAHHTKAPSSLQQSAVLVISHQAFAAHEHHHHVAGNAPYGTFFCSPFAILGHSDFNMSAGDVVVSDP